MASYHFEAKIIGRSTGRSAVAAAAYRSGQKLRRSETGEEHDYTRKRGVVVSGILAPESAPDWAFDRAKLWNAVEAKEARSNSQLAREFTLALPHELDIDDAIRMVSEWAYENLVDRGMCVDLAIHDPEPAPGRNRNLHAHLLITTREFALSTKDGWAKNKNREWNSADLLVELRESWAVAQNQALERAGFSERVDSRSLEAQRNAALERGDEASAIYFDRPPEPRLGVAATAMEKRAAQKAAREGREYQPVTVLGQQVAAMRSARSVLCSAVSAVRSAARTVTRLVGRLGLSLQRPSTADSEISHAPMMWKNGPNRRPEPEPDSEYEFGL